MMYPRLNYSQGSALVTCGSISISSVKTGCRLDVINSCGFRSWFNSDNIICEHLNSQQRGCHKILTSANYLHKLIDYVAVKICLQ